MINTPYKRGYTRPLFLITNSSIKARTILLKSYISVTNLWLEGQHLKPQDSSAESWCVITLGRLLLWSSASLPLVELWLEELRKRDICHAMLIIIVVAVIAKHPKLNIISLWMHIFSYIYCNMIIRSSTLHSIMVEKNWGETSKTGLIM